MLGYMLQLLRLVCGPIISAVPLVNPLNDPEPHTFVAEPILMSSKHYYAQNVQQQQPQSGSAHKRKSTSKNFSSFGGAIKANQDIPI